VTQPVLAVASLPALFDDNPALEDLLGFDAVVEPVLDALRHEDLDPITVGVHAPWGGGKSTVLNLLEAASPKDWIVVRTTPWEYEDQFDVKGTLIAEVLSAIEPRVEAEEELKDKVTDLFKSISWSRVGMVVAKGALTMQWDPEKLVEAFSPQKKEGPRSLAAFRAAFEELVAKVPGVTRVVVLVDDLDRCLPDATVATLEAIKLFLSVKRMAFVIAADQDLVREAIAASLAGTNRSGHFAERYLEKIVQLPVSMPRLSPAESEAYIAILLTQAAGGTTGIKELVEHAAKRRAKNEPKLLDDLGALAVRPSEEHLRLAQQLNDGMASDKRGNPREIKRRLNAFAVRSQLTAKRGVEIRPDALLKMLLLEVRFPKPFEVLVGKSSPERRGTLEAWEKWGRGETQDVPADADAGMRDWAESAPALAGLDLDAYITLAGTLTAAAIGSGLSNDLRVAVQRLLSDSTALFEQAKATLAECSKEDLRRVGSVLLDHGRGADPDSVANVISGLAVVAKLDPDEAVGYALGIRTRMFNGLTAAAGGALASSEVEPFVTLAREALALPAIDEATKVAIRLNLEPN
jgi:hypothetical protein